MTLAKAGRRRVLLVDDEVLLHHAFDRAARETGIEILHAMDGATGIEVANTRRPDLILLDMGLPDMEGSEFSSASKARRTPPLSP